MNTGKGFPDDLFLLHYGQGIQFSSRELTEYRTQVTGSYQGIPPAEISVTFKPCSPLLIEPRDFGKHEILYFTIHVVHS